MLQKFATLLAAALVDYAVKWLKDPANRDDVEKASVFVLDKITAAIPGEWDDHLAQLVTDGITGKLPDFGPLDDVVKGLQKLLNGLPGGGFLGGLLGGR